MGIEGICVMYQLHDGSSTMCWKANLPDMSTAEAEATLLRSQGFHWCPATGTIDRTSHTVWVEER